MNINDNNFSIILYVAIISFFGAISKEINDTCKKETDSFFMFIGEVVLHGFSGWIVGLIAVKYFKLTDLISLTIYSGLGGLFGYDLAKIVLKIILTSISKTAELSDLDKNNGDKKDKVIKRIKKAKK